MAEHVALELQTRAGHPVTRGKTRSVKGRPGVYNVMFAYEEEPVGLLAGRLALGFVQSLLPDDLRGIEGLDRLAEGDGAPFDLEAALQHLTRLARRVGLGPSTKAIVAEARHLGPAAGQVEPDPARHRRPPEAHPREPDRRHGPDRTDEIHPDNAAIARRAALCVGLDVAVSDFVAPDIARSVRETGGGIIEVNAAPGLRMHLQPSEGRARNVARPIVDHLFPK